MNEAYPFLTYDPELSPRVWTVFADTLSPEEYYRHRAEKAEVAKQWLLSQIDQLDGLEIAYLKAMLWAISMPMIFDGAMDRFMLFVKQWTIRTTATPVEAAKAA